MDKEYTISLGYNTVSSAYSDYIDADNFYYTCINWLIP